MHVFIRTENQSVIITVYETEKGNILSANETPEKAIFRVKTTHRLVQVRGSTPDNYDLAA